MNIGFIEFKKGRSYFFSLFLLALFFLPATSWSAVNISELILDNGLKVIVKPDRRSPIAVFQIWYKIGSSYEQEGKTGVSHMLEHLMFKSSRNNVLQAGFNRLNDIGARGNAYTHRDHTFYYHMLEKKHLELSFLVEAERMKGINPTQEDFEIEKKVILEELEYANTKDPHLSAYETLYEKGFKKSGYRLPIIGYPEDIQVLTLPDVMRWYQQYYTPGNATIVVTGDVEKEDVFALARKYFSGIKKISPKLQPIVFEKHPKKEVRYVMPQNTQVGMLLMGFRVPSLATAEPTWEAYALDVLAGWFESGHNSRLSKAMIIDQKQAYEVTVTFSIMKRQNTLFVIEVIPASGASLKHLEQALNDEIELIKKELISRSTLRKIKNQMIATEIYERDSLYTQAKIIGQAEVIGIHWSDDAKYIKRIKAVTPEQIKQVINKYFVPENKVVVLQQAYE